MDDTPYRSAPRPVPAPDAIAVVTSDRGAGWYAVLVRLKSYRVTVDGHDWPIWAREVDARSLTEPQARASADRMARKLIRDGFCKVVHIARTFGEGPDELLAVYTAD